MKVILNEKQYKQFKNYLLEGLEEADNPAFDRGNATEGMKKIWELIDKKQKRLQSMVFGKLEDKLDDLTLEKSKLLGAEHLKIPHTICRAGNSKLPEGVLIINMSSSLMCPSFYLGLCKIKDGACYAQRAENQYTTTVMPNRFQTDLMHTQMLKQYQSGNKNPMKEYFRIVELYIQLANKYATDECVKAIKNAEIQLRRKLTKEEKEFIKITNSKNRITDVRLNETGDFHCQLAVDLWANFAKKIKRKYGIDTHAYTARNLDFSKASNYISMNYSHDGEYENENNKPRYFQAVSDVFYTKLPDTSLDENYQPILKTHTKPDGTMIRYYKCPCGDNESACDRCGVCFKPNATNEEYIIYVKLHVKNASGLKSAFKQDEIKPIVNMWKQSGWATNDEYNVSTQPHIKDKFNIFDKNIDRLRKGYIKKKK